MQRAELETGKSEFFDYKPKQFGTQKQGRSARNMEKWLERKQAKLAARGRQRLSGNNGERR